MSRHLSARNQMSHAEIMDQRHLKRKKKEKKEKKDKYYHLKEYMTLTDNEEITKKSVARSIMDIVEEINDQGMNEKRYLDMMNQLMSLNNEEPSPPPIYNIPADDYRSWDSATYIIHEPPAPTIIGSTRIISRNARSTESIGALHNQITESIGRYGVGHLSRISRAI